MHSSLRFLALSGLVAGSILASGCVSSGVRNPSGVPVKVLRPDEPGIVAGTGIESQDLVSVTDKMARSLVGIPQLYQSLTPPRIGMLLVKNETRFTINKDMFLDRLQGQLAAKTTGRMVFLARDRMAHLERERQL